MQYYPKPEHCFVVAAVVVMLFVAEQVQEQTLVLSKRSQLPKTNKFTRIKVFKNLTLPRLKELFHIVEYIILQGIDHLAKCSNLSLFNGQFAL